MRRIVILRPSVVRTLPIVLCALVCGCGGDGFERVSISGNATYDGQPIPWGQIRFIPIGENAGPSWGALIKSGHYATEGKGVPVGTLRVEITALRGAITHGVPNIGMGSTTKSDDSEPLEQYIPPKYHLHSELQLTVEPGSGDVVQDFQLTSK